MCVYIYAWIAATGVGHRRRANVATAPRNVRRSTASRVVSKWMTGTCERRLPPSSPPPPPLPPPLPPRLTARHDTPMSDDQRRQPPCAAGPPHRRINESERADTHTTHGREQQWQATLRLASTASCPAPTAAPFSSPLPPPAPSLPLPARVKGVDRRGRESRSVVSPGEFVGYEEENLCVSPFSLALPVGR